MVLTHPKWLHKLVKYLGKYSLVGNGVFSIEKISCQMGHGLPTKDIWGAWNFQLQLHNNALKLHCL
jgi:hypothetical protein